jgi:potassium/chloride transporter 4/5/6
LVIVNLPDPDSLIMSNPAAYARYVEAIVRGLKRVVYVHGTGREVCASPD